MMISGKEMGTPHTSSYGAIPKSKRYTDDGAKDDIAGRKKQSSDFAKNRGPIFGQKEDSKQ